MTASVVLLDLDGVVRHWDPRITVEIERRHGIPAGSIVTVASGRRLMNALVTGVITRAEWLAQIAGIIGSPEAVREWGEQPASVDVDVIDGVRRARRSSVRVALLTNGTDTVNDELARLGLADDFDAVFNSASIGQAKPNLEIYVHVLTALDVAPQHVLYVDDAETHVRAAAALGLRAIQFGPDTRGAALAEISKLAD